MEIVRAGLQAATARAAFLNAVALLILGLSRFHVRAPALTWALGAGRVSHHVATPVWTVATVGAVISAGRCCAPTWVQVDLDQGRALGRTRAPPTRHARCDAAVDASDADPRGGPRGFTMRLASGKSVPAAKQYFRNATSEVAGHETVDDRIEGAVRVTQEQTV